MINIQTRKQFDLLLQAIEKCDIMVVDTETNGLKHYRGDTPISISFYFPQTDMAFNFPFAHGEGKIVPRYNASNPEGKPFEQMNWVGYAKKDLHLSRRFEELKPSIDFGNCPIEWLEELKPLWARPTHVYHNAKFDMHMLASIGFPVPAKVIDTLLLLHVVYNDWNAIDVEAPYTEDGLWVRNPDGSLAKKKQNGNRQLKWQSARLGFKGATEGEDGLQAAATKFEALLSEGQDHAIQMDKKAHMWMLPSHDVAYYAMMDTKLTWDLYQWIKPVIAQWNNEHLAEQFNNSQMAAFVMEQNGFKLDVAAAQREVDILEPRLREIESWFDFKLGYAIHLCQYLNSGVLGRDWDKPLPDWFPDNKRQNTRLYPDAVLKDTTAETMEKYDNHLVVRIILEYRQMKKTRDTYLTTWLEAADADGIVRGSVKVDGTITGRTSSSGDAGNLQNIPERKGYTIKRAIVPYDDNWLMFGIDYGQLEGRLAAWIAEDLLVKEGVHNLPPRMQPLFNGVFDAREFPSINQDRIMKDGGVDLHSFTREVLEVRQTLYPNLTDAEVLSRQGYDPAKVTGDHAKVVDKEMRQVAKTINFGLLYSGTKYMLSKELRVSLEAADVLVQRWRKIFPAFAIAQEHFTELALTRRPNPTKTAIGMYVTQPISGRHLKYGLHSKWRYNTEDKKWFNLQEASAKKAWNAVVQGLGGYLMPVSYFNFQEKYGSEGVKPFAVIHDSVDGYIHKDYMWKLDKIMECMVDWKEINPNLTVELSLSKTNWQDFKAVESWQKWLASS